MQIRLAKALLHVMISRALMGKVLREMINLRVKIVLVKILANRLVILIVLLTLGIVGSVRAIRVKKNRLLLILNLMKN